VTVKELRRRVKAIRAARHDDEHAHGLEDALRRDVLKAIADGAKNASALAAEALKTSEIGFARWTA